MPLFCVHILLNCYFPEGQGTTLYNLAGALGKLFFYVFYLMQYKTAFLISQIMA